MNSGSRYLKTTLCLLFLSLTVVLPLHAQAQLAGNDTTYTITKARIWLEGATNINRFSCQTYNADGMGGHNEALEAADSILNVSYSPKIKNDNSLQGWLKVGVTSLDCGNKHMNKDMYHSLKSDSFPNIFFTLETANLIKPGLTQKDPFKVETTGELTIAGQTREIKVIAKGYLLKKGCFRVQGSKPILMSDYNINPPSPFFGIVKTKDQITVHFDLIATPVPVTHFASVDAKPECTSGVDLRQ